MPWRGEGGGASTFHLILLDSGGRVGAAKGKGWVISWKMVLVSEVLAYKRTLFHMNPKSIGRDIISYVLISLFIQRFVP
jgi:hypothetical protein